MNTNELEKRRRRFLAPIFSETARVHCLSDPAKFAEHLEHEKQSAFWKCPISRIPLSAEEWQRPPALAA